MKGVIVFFNSTFKIDTFVKSSKYNFVRIHDVVRYDKYATYCVGSLVIRLFTKLSKLSIKDCV